MKKLKAIGHTVKYLLIFSLVPVICALLFSLFNILLVALKINPITLPEYLLEMVSCILIMLVFYIISRKRKVSFTKEIKLKKISPLSAIFCILLGLSIGFTFEFIFSSLFNCLPFLEEWFVPTDSTLIIPTNGLEIVLLFISTVIAAPIVEEITFRGFMYSKLKNGFPKIVSYLLVSAIFAVLHGALIDIVYAFFGAVLMFWVFDRCESVIASILVHAFNNLLAILVYMVDTSSFEIPLAIISIIVFVVSLVGIFFDTRKLQTQKSNL